MKSQHSPLYRLIAFASCASLLLITLTPMPALQKPFPSYPLTSRPAITSSIVPASQPENPASPPVISALSAKTLPSPQTFATASDSAERTQHVYRALLTPTGPLYANQPFLSRISAATAWQTFANTNGAPVIAVIDTGFALNHDSLKNRWHRNAFENNGLSDTDANGYPGDWQGWDFIHNDNDPRAGSTNPSGAGGDPRDDNGRLGQHP